jgi:hypothetical protein
MQKLIFFARSRTSKNYIETYKWNAVQAIPQIDPLEIGSKFPRAGAEIAEKVLSRMETNKHYQYNEINTSAFE